jgi:tetratricopeptide (TPR) repeat protein
MSTPGFDLERIRLESSQSLPASCFDDFQRLTKTLVHGPSFQWLLVEAVDQRLRDRVIDSLDNVLSEAQLKSTRLVVDANTADVSELEQNLVRCSTIAPVVHVVVATNWFDEEGKRWDALNARRERLARDAKARLVFWLNKEGIDRAARFAPDLWAWRGGVYTFEGFVDGANSTSLERLDPEPTGLDTRSMAERHRRIAEIRAWLEANSAPPDDLLIPILDELGRLLYSVGDYDGALVHWRDRELPIYERLGDERSRAFTMGQIADILEARGELDEALRIRREEELPIYERLGDVCSRAITMGQIAEVLTLRGELDEALRIRREEELPIYERLGDVRSRAITMGNTADILATRGELDEALRIRREEELPIYERLGDDRSRAVTMGQIADILAARGELDEALRIRREEELPIYERLGDVRSRAITMGKIADILAARGELDEALRIRREEELPIYERLGDVRSRAITMGKMADILATRGELDEALRIRREEELPIYERLGDVRSRAITKGKIANILAARGELDEALRIYREEVLPVLERLNGVRSLIVSRTNVARMLIRRAAVGDKEEADQLLLLALADAERLCLPDAKEIRALRKEAELPDV